jgi:hypothetical protein
MTREDGTGGPFTRYDGPPMTLGNMRANGVRTLDAWCQARGCHHHSTVDGLAVLAALLPQLRVP